MHKLSPFQHQILQEEFAAVLATFEGQDLDKEGVLMDKVQTALRKKLQEIIDYEPAYAGSTVMVSPDPDDPRKLVVNVRRPGLAGLVLVPVKPG